MAENTQVPSGSKETKIEKIKRHINLHKRKVIILSLLVALMVVFFNLNPGARPLEVFKIDPLEFGVVEASPRNISVDKSTQVEIKFNFPVTAHHAEQYIVMTPQVLGSWEQGSASNSIVFKPSFEYYAGSQVSVTLLPGLPSESGKKLTTEYNFNFSVKLDGTDFRFVRGDYSYRLTSFDVASGISLGVLTGSELKNPSAKLFSVPNETELINNFVHGAEPYLDSSVYPTTMPDTKSFKELQTFNLLENNQVSYKGDVGIYYLAGFDDSKFIDGTWILINKTGVLFREDDKNIYLAAQDLATKKEVTNLPVTFYDITGRPQIISSHTIKGITSIPFDTPTRLDLIMAKNAGEVILVPVYLPNSRAELRVNGSFSDKYQVFVNTDRPIYKPGDTVKFRAVVRVDNDGAYSVPITGTEISLNSYLLNYSVKARTDAAGIVSGEIVLPNIMPPNPYNDGKNFIYLDANLGNSYTGGTVFEVADYKKPEFDIVVNLDKADYVKPDTIRAQISGKYFNGDSLKDTDVDYVVFRRDFYETQKAVYNTTFNLNAWGGMCGGGFGVYDDYYGEEVKKGSVRLDASGNAYLDFSTSELKAIISQEITILAKKKDGLGNELVGTKTAVVRAGEFNVFLNNRFVSFESGQRFDIPFLAEDRSGAPVSNKEFSYRIYQVSYDANGAFEFDVKTGTAKTNEQGFGHVVDSIENNNWLSIFLEVTSVDSKGNKVGGSRYLNILPKGFKNQNPTVLDITSEKNNLIVGEEAELIINSPDDMTVLVSFERGRVYDAQWLDLKKGQNSYRFTVKEIYAPSVTPTFAFFYQGNYNIEGLSLNVPAMHKLVNVSITADKQSYKPGEVARVTIKTTDSNNKPVIANVGAAVVDKAIFALRKKASASIHTDLYFFRDRETNASSSMTGVMVYPWGDGGKGGGGGDGSALQDKFVDTLLWNPNLRTNSNGEVTIEVPTNNYLTTWRIQVYASTSDTKVGQGTLDFTVN